MNIPTPYGQILSLETIAGQPQVIVGKNSQPADGEPSTLTADQSINGSPLTIGSAVLGASIAGAPYFCYGRSGNVWTAYLPWTNYGSDLVVEVTQTGASIPLTLYVTIDGDETPYTFGGASNTNTFTIHQNETLESVEYACYF